MQCRFPHGMDESAFVVYAEYSHDLQKYGLAFADVDLDSDGPLAQSNINHSGP